MPKQSDEHCCYKELKPTTVKCPECKQGVFAPAWGRFGPIYRCTNKKECKNVLLSRPTGKKCTYKRQSGRRCGALIVEGTKTIPDRCSDRECPFRNPHKLHK